MTLALLFLLIADTPTHHPTEFIVGSLEVKKADDYIIFRMTGGGARHSISIPVSRDLDEPRKQGLRNSGVLNSLGSESLQVGGDL